MSLLHKTRSWYGRFERPISSISLISGFVFDAVTLKRVDTLWENIWILVHLLVVGVFIVLINVKQNNVGDETDPSKAHFWYVNILQFFFGGILSTFLVFYFRSTDIWVTWPFLLILALAFWANESWKRQYTRLSFQISLFFLSIYSFLIFFLPVVFHEISSWLFVLSGILSLLIITIFTTFVFRYYKGPVLQSRRLAFRFVAGIFILINFLYFTNLIPPIPLSLKDAGVYHYVHKNISGNYDVTYEDYGWIKYIKRYDEFHEVEESPVYAYSAIFSPKNLNVDIVHEWQYYNENIHKWVTRGTINLSVVGGRDGGFRTYSMKTNLDPGKWRVTIKTKQGQIIGHIFFKIITTTESPILVGDIKK